MRQYPAIEASNAGPRIVITAQNADSGEEREFDLEEIAGIDPDLVALVLEASNFNDQEARFFRFEGKDWYVIRAESRPRS